jgi:hypothetical protein
MKSVTGSLALVDLARATVKKNVASVIRDHQ